MNVFDPMGTFNDAQNMAYSQQQKYAGDRARKRAGQAMQAGDVKGATGALYGAGDIQGAQGIEDQQGQQQDRQFRHDQQTAQVQQQQAAQKAAQMKRMAISLRDVPPEQRAQVFHSQVAPALIQLGMKQEDMAGVENHLDDASLNVFAGEMDKQIQALQLGNGGLATFNNRTGDVNVIREPYRDPLAGQLTQAKIDATRAQVGQRDAMAARARRPAASGRGGGSSPSVPHGFVLD